jgi:hypothetical protein
MFYNTTREQIEMREYGRHIQGLINYAITIEDKTKRQKTAEAIIQLMIVLNPQLKNVVDYKQKLWDHLFIISKFKLEVDSPYPIPTEETARIKPTHLPYPQNNIKYRHYGKNVEAMIQKAIAMDDLNKKATFTEIIGNFMKLTYKNWSNEEVNNDLVKDDLKTMSKGLLEISDEMNIETMTKLHRKKSFQQQQQNNSRNSKNKRNNRNKRRI